MVSVLAHVTMLSTPPVPSVSVLEAVWVDVSPGRGGSPELTEQKIGLMLLEVCHQPGGSAYLRQIYHIIRLNEVGKRSFCRAIRRVLA